MPVGRPGWLKYASYDGHNCLFKAPGKVKINGKQAPISQDTCLPTLANRQYMFLIHKIL